MMLDKQIVERIAALERRIAEMEAGEVLDRRANILEGISYLEDFGDIPSDYSWAGTPFSTPPSVAITNNTVLSASGFTGSEKAFFYKPVTNELNSATNFYFLPTNSTNSAGQYAGLRIDSGTDNNYVEIVVEYQNANPPLLYKIYYRTGGGTITAITPSRTSSGSFMPDAIKATIVGTKWTSWQIVEAFVSNYTTVLIGATTPFFSWTPTRIGFVGKFGTAASAINGMDFIAW
jgi:hypothetical protein